METEQFTVESSQVLSIPYNPNDTAYGIYITTNGILPDIKETWQRVKQDILAANYPLSGPALTIKMPCGSQKIFQTNEEVENLPMKDIPCDCGRTNHYYLKFQIGGEAR